ncbi:RNA polymerase-binding protein DksA [Candidatus Persebacteraceae bacterium Df01]|jgi:DnaK suppressor protein|uniref:RNA polymerase-binding protein DksA n=1 Tax=Candidatus Doriopsillibacter californiensis TaxID=2970740 RepID=A0ABT7QMS6_9GAMM|nr:RNA polymerase-binding protein DksA [Candidatus Persebacteraceae bacterium Df01]
MPNQKNALPVKKGKAVGAYRPTATEKYMSVKQIKYFTDLLRQTLNQIGVTADKTIDALRVSDEHTPDENDRASKEADFALELRERERESFLVQKIRHALRRLDNHEYGYCEECGESIGIDRLLARPVATLCFECKNLQEYQEKTHS